MMMANVWLAAAGAASAQSPQAAQATQATQATPGESQNPAWQALDERADKVYESEGPAAAALVAKEALALAKTPREIGQSKGKLGLLLHMSGDRATAEKYLRESLEVRLQTFGDQSIEYAQAAHDLAMWNRDIRRHSQALELAEQAVAIRKRLLRPSDLLVLQAMDMLASIYSVSGDFTTALRVFEETIALHEAVPEAERSLPDYGVLCVNAAGSYQRLGKFERAEATLLKGRDALRIRPGTGHLAYIAATAQLASLKADMAQYPDAETLYQEAIRLLDQTPPHPYLAIVLNNRGVMNAAIGNYAQAEQDLDRSIVLKSQRQPRESVDVGLSLVNYGLVVNRVDRVKGEALLREAAAILAKAKAPAYEQVNALLALARVERERGAWSETEATLKRALSIAESLGPEHYLYGAVLRDLGPAQQAQGDHEGAERSSTRALALAEVTYGPRNPQLLSYLRPLAQVYDRRLNATAALEVYRRSFEIEDDFLNTVFSIGPELFKERILASLPDPVHALIGFQIRAGDTLPGARVFAFEAAVRHKSRVLAFEAAIRRKGRVLEQVRDLQLRVHSGPAVDRLIADLSATMRCRTSLTLALGDRSLTSSFAGPCSLEGTERAGRYEKLLTDLRLRAPGTTATATAAIADLEAHEKELDATLTKQLGRPVMPRGVATLDTLAQALRPDEVLIELVAYHDDDPSSTRPASRKKEIKNYGAFVLDAKGELSWVSLGLAGPIEDEVQYLMKAANDWSDLQRAGEKSAGQEVAETAERALKKIGSLVWTPIEPLLARAGAGTIRRLRISPDSVLNLVPFDAIPTGANGKKLIDRFSIAYLPAGRDLLRTSLDVPHTAPIVIVSAGSPDGAYPHADKRPYLPNAGIEAKYVRQRLPGAQLQTDAAASEHAVKQLISPHVLHVVGHGEVDANEECSTPSCPVPSPGSGAMGLSRIVFHEAYGPVAGSKEDGLLTAAELQNIDLRGTAMLVLAHCQMAGGVPSVGEGVYGMRRAAAVAGARTFVAPLWRVVDDVQSKLMQRFYKRLSDGQSRADALRDAKLLIRSNPDTRSFLYWAPVILSGEDGPLSTLAQP